MGLPSPPRPLLMSASSHSLLPHPPPCPRHTAARRGLSSRGEVAANSLARTALAQWRDSGEGREQRRWQLPAEVEDTRPQSWAEPWRPRLPFFLSAELGRDSGTGPKKRAGNLVYRPGRGALRAFVWKVSIAGSRGNVFLVTLAQGGQVGGKGGRLARFSSAFGGGSRG